MKKLYLLLMLTPSLFAYVTDNWIHNFETARTQAKTQHKKIYLFIGAKNCRFCTLFKEKTLSKPEVIQRLKQEYILVYLSRDTHTIPKMFAKFGVPRHYFLDENGKIFFETFGVLEPAGFFTILDEAELYEE